MHKIKIEQTVMANIKNIEKASDNSNTGKLSTPIMLCNLNFLSTLYKNFKFLLLSIDLI